MTASTSVGIDDDLASSQTRICGRASLDEVPGRVDVEDGLLIEKLSRHHLADELIDDLRLDILLQVSLGSVLGRDDDRVHPGGRTIYILNGDL